MRQKIANIPNTSIATQTQTQPNTTPLVNLDNPSTLTISDLFKAHSSFHLIFLFVHILEPDFDLICTSFAILGLFS